MSFYRLQQAHGYDAANYLNRNKLIRHFKNGPSSGANNQWQTLGGGGGGQGGACSNFDLQK